MSYLGRWAAWYRGLDGPQAYGDTRTYELAAEFLSDCETVEDWGCGKGFFGTLISSGYRGIDGTETPFTDVVADLVEYQSRCDGVLLRHVLEHNREWRTILDNAAATASYKICIILFTPCAEFTREIAFTADLGVPDIAFRLCDIYDHLEEFDVITTKRFRTATQYGEETMICASRS